MGSFYKEVGDKIMGRWGCREKWEKIMSLEYSFDPIKSSLPERHWVVPICLLVFIKEF